MDNINELSYRANINLRTINSKDVVLYEDHRTILNVLFYLKIKTPTSFPLNVILFDDHDDAGIPAKEALAQIEKFLAKEPTLREFWSFTEFDLRNRDDDWIKAGMELGLVNNLFLFNSKESVLSFESMYRTKKFGTKKIYNLGFIWDALVDKGCLNATFNKVEFGSMWKDFGWKFNKKYDRHIFNPGKQFIVDFDLDCFTTEILNKRLAIPEEVLFEKFSKSVKTCNHLVFNCQDFVKELIQKSLITTMCFESTYCGGFRQSFRAFEMVDYLFFDNQLGQYHIVQ